MRRLKGYELALLIFAGQQNGYVFAALTDTQYYQPATAMYLQTLPQIQASLNSGQPMYLTQTGQVATEATPVASTTTTVQQQQQQQSTDTTTQAADTTAAAGTSTTASTGTTTASDTTSDTTTSDTTTTNTSANTAIAVENDGTCAQACQNSGICA